MYNLHPTEPLYQVLEYMSHGNLYNFLRLIDHKMSKEQLGDMFIGAGPKMNLDEKRLKMLQITFARDIANGMAYLASEQVRCVRKNSRYK